MRVIWPTGLIGRVGLVLLAAVLLELAASTFIFERAELVSIEDAQARRIAVQLDAAVRVLDASEPALRPALATALSEPELSFVWTDTAAALPPSAAGDQLRGLRASLLADAPRLASRDLRLQPDEIDPADGIEGNITLGDGSSLAFRARGLDQAPPDLAANLGSIALLSGAVLLAALLVVRTLAAPLRMLVAATDAIGRGPPVQLDAARGPGEIRRVARAFNAMQGRIEKLLKDRTDALAAVSHDLRTPIARMRLRADVGGAREDQAALVRDLAELEAMLDDLLAYLRGETDPEPARRTNIAATLQTLVDNATDAGLESSYAGPDQCVLVVRSLALKRAFANLINNAIAYGECARVTLEETATQSIVLVDDDGPGIPETERDAVFEPFYRGDASRNRAKGGMGLGLAIARAAVSREGGSVELANRDEGGLRVAIRLPRR